MLSLKEDTLSFQELLAGGQEMFQATGPIVAVSRYRTPLRATRDADFFVDPTRPGS